MSGVVHFKFRSAISFDNVVFDGHFITVAELKRLIAEKKGLGREAATELVLSDPRTNTEYTDDSFQVPKNSSVLVRRVPITKHKTIQSTADVTITHTVVAAPTPASEPEPSAAAAAAQEDEFGGDLYADQAAAQAQYEEESRAISSIVDSTAKDWQAIKATGRGRGRGGGRMGGRGFPGAGELRPGYICYRCGKPGHRIMECPTKDDPTFEVKQRVRHSAGIPMSKLARSEEGGLLLPDGNLGALLANKSVLEKEIAALPTLSGRPDSHPPTPEPAQKQEPEDQKPAAAANAAAHKQQAAAGLFDDDDDMAPPAQGGKAVELGLGMDALLEKKPLAAAQAGTGSMLQQQQQAQLQLQQQQQQMQQLQQQMPLVRQQVVVPEPQPLSPEMTAELLLQLRDVLPQGPMKAIVAAFLGDLPLSQMELEDLQHRFRAEQRPMDAPRGGRSSAGNGESYPPPRPPSRQYNDRQYNGDLGGRLGAGRMASDEIERPQRRYSPVPAPGEFEDLRDFLTSKARKEEGGWGQRRPRSRSPSTRFEDQRDRRRPGSSAGPGAYDSRPSDRFARRFDQDGPSADGPDLRCLSPVMLRLGLQSGWWHRLNLMQAASSDHNCNVICMS